MNKNKILLILSFTLLLINSIFGVVIVENPNAQQLGNNQEPNTFFQAFGGAIFMGLLIGVGLGGFILVVWLIVRKIKENQRKVSDLLYSRFLIELKNCHQNRDVRLKRRNLWTFGLTWKREEIYINTDENGVKYFGKYDGELIVKDNFILYGVYRVTGIFSREKDIIIIPYELRNKARKELIKGKWVVTIYGEGIDEVLNTDFFNEVVFKNPLDNDKLITFTDYIHKQYLENYVYRQIIKDNLFEYKDSLDKITELNPNIQVERKNPKQ